MNVYRYDALSVQQVDWANNNDPTSESTDGQYLIPQGQWITVEEHIKLNTTDSNTAYNSNVDRADGIAEVINGILKLRKNRCHVDEVERTRNRWYVDVHHLWW